MPETRRRVGKRRRGPYVPAQVVVDLIELHVPAELIYERLQVAQVSTHLIRHVRNGQIVNLTIDQVDRILVCAIGDNTLWHTVPELAAVYAVPWDDEP